MEPLEIGRIQQLVHGVLGSIDRDVERAGLRLDRVPLRIRSCRMVVAMDATQTYEGSVQ